MSSIPTFMHTTQHISPLYLSHVTQGPILHLTFDLSEMCPLHHSCFVLISSGCKIKHDELVTNKNDGKIYCNLNLGCCQSTTNLHHTMQSSNSSQLQCNTTAWTLSRTESHGHYLMCLQETFNFMPIFNHFHHD